MKLVLKFGTGILTKNEGTSLNLAQFTKLVDAVSQLKAEGHDCILVSSGAVGAGLMAFGLTQRPTDTAGLQAAAAVGQSRLMHLYETRFREHELKVAQLLLTNQEFENPEQRQNVCNTLTRLLELDGVIPIINENDSVAVEELKFGDNDLLSAHVAIVAGADKLILLTSVPGLFDENDKVIETVENVDEVSHLVNGKIGTLSTGGMASKLEAVKEAVSAGIETLIASGHHPDTLADLVAGRGTATRFLPRD